MCEKQENYCFHAQNITRNIEWDAHIVRQKYAESLCSRISETKDWWLRVE